MRQKKSQDRTTLTLFLQNERLFDLYLFRKTVLGRILLDCLFQGSVLDSQGLQFLRCLEHAIFCLGNLVGLAELLERGRDCEGLCLFISDSGYREYRVGTLQRGGEIYTASLYSNPTTLMGVFAFA